MNLFIATMIVCLISFITALETKNSILHFDTVIVMFLAIWVKLFMIKY